MIINITDVSKLHCFFW